MAINVLCPNCNTEHSVASQQIIHCSRCGYTACMNCEPTIGACPKCGSVSFFPTTEKSLMDRLENK